MNACKACLMITIYFSMSQGENHFTKSSIKTFLTNLLKFHKIDIKRRWCFFCLRWLIDNGYIRRKSRYVQDSNGVITQIPSLITFTLKGVVYLVRMGVSGAKKIHKSMISYLKKGDKRFPSRPEYDNENCFPADPEQRNSLLGLLGIVTKNIQ